MEVFQDWTTARMQDLQHTWLVRVAMLMPLCRCINTRFARIVLIWLAVSVQVLSQSYQARSLPGRHDFTASMLWTSAALVLLPNLLAVLARKKSRKLLLDTLESILAVILVIILLGIVLGLPVGRSLHTPVPFGTSDGNHGTRADV